MSATMQDPEGGAGCLSRDTLGKTSDLTEFDAAAAEWLSALAGWRDCRYVPVDRQGASAIGAAVMLREVSVTWETWEQPVCVTGAVPDGTLGILVVDDRPSGCVAWGRPVGADQLCVTASEIDVLLGPRSRVYAAVIPVPRLEKAAARLGLELDERMIRNPGQMRVPQDALRAVRSGFTQAMQATGPEAAPEDEESRFLAAISVALSRPGPTAVDASRRLPLARAVRDHLEEHLSRPFRLDQLTAAVGADARRVQRAFQDVFGMSPSRYVHSRRLDLARRRLRRGTPQSATVTQIAISCGLDHLGRFATDYRARFGESPSATLRRDGLGD
jgi:AraC-like DNA-binding protein